LIIDATVNFNYKYISEEMHIDPVDAKAWGEELKLYQT
jgi:hypothetical protein